MRLLEDFECMQCGEVLELGVKHECPVGGNTVLVTEGDRDGNDGNEE